MSRNVTSVPESILQLQSGSKYFGLTFVLPLGILGVIGNVINIFVFFILGNYKYNASSLYVLCKSFYDLSELIFGLGLYVLNYNFQISFDTKSQIWCKIHGSIIDISSLNSFTCLCLQAIDAFLSSSSSPALRRKSQVRTARYILICCFIFWLCHQIPYMIFQDLIIKRGIPRCLTTNSIYIKYRLYFVFFGLNDVIPTVIIGIFGFLTYRNLHVPMTMSATPRQHYRSLSLSHLTKQMTRMTLFQIVCVSIFQIPVFVMYIYSMVTEGTEKSALRWAQEQLAQLISRSWTYGTFASPFYCYWTASKRFRRQVIHILTSFVCYQRRVQLPTETISHMISQ